MKLLSVDHLLHHSFHVHVSNVDGTTRVLNVNMTGGSEQLTSWRGMLEISSSQTTARSLLWLESIDATPAPSDIGVLTWHAAIVLLWAAYLPAAFFLLPVLIMRRKRLLLGRRALCPLALGALLLGQKKRRWLGSLGLFIAAALRLGVDAATTHWIGRIRGERGRGMEGDKGGEERRERAGRQIRSGDHRGLARFRLSARPAPHLRLLSCPKKCSHHRGRRREHNSDGCRAYDASNRSNRSTRYKRPGRPCGRLRRVQFGGLHLCL